MKSLTPMVKQYLEIKSQYPDAILFYRIGDFYEMFFEDAHVGSKELDIVLTSRDKGNKDSVPLCGVPHHAADTYITKLLEKGYKVAVCEQVEDPKVAKGLVKRDVIRVYTPGLVTDSVHLGTGDNNYLMGFCAEGEVFGLAFLDISTGECKAVQISGYESFLNEVLRNEPKEIVALKAFQQHPCFKRFGKVFENEVITFLEDSTFHLNPPPTEMPGRMIAEDGKRVDENPLAAVAVAMVLRYAEENQKKDLAHIRPVAFYRLQDFMVIDETTKRNLELTQSLFDQGKKGSLFWVMDETVTAMGGRKLKQWLHYPLLDIQAIEARLEAVSELKEKKIERKRLRESLKEIQDIERLTSRIFLGQANARDLVGLKRSLQKLPSLRGILHPFEAPLLKEELSDVETFDDLTSLLESSIVEDPP